MPEAGPSPGFKALRWLKPVYAGDTVRFSAAATSGTFAAGPPAFPGYGHLAVVQTPDGVQLRGPFDSSPAGSTDIPLHAAGA